MNRAAPDRTRSRTLVAVAAGWIVLVGGLLAMTTATDACDGPGAASCANPPNAGSMRSPSLGSVASGDASAPAPSSPTAEPSPSAERTPAPSEAASTFRDEFNGDRLRPVWGRHWPGFGATDWSSSQVSVAGGYLTITARREGSRFVSGLIDTVGKFTQRYGVFTARLRFESGAGLWPAFWLAQPQNPAREMAEIDVMEVCANPPGTRGGNDVTLLHPVVHRPDGTVAFSRSLRTANLADGWHEYSVEWRPDRIVFFLDGIEYDRYTEAAEIPDMPMALVLDFAGGGNWCGPANDSTPAVATMQVDWVRASN